MAVKLYPATIFQRVTALALDFFFLALAAGFVMAPIIAVAFNYAPRALAIPIYIFFLLLALFAIPLAETIFSGQTIGKMLLGIRTIRTDGSPATGVHFFQRYLMQVVDIVFTFGFGGVITAMITERSQRMGDLVADTMVVRIKPDRAIYNRMARLYYTEFTPQDKDDYTSIADMDLDPDTNDPLALAECYRALQCKEALLRTHKAHPALIEWVQSLISETHLKMFRRKSYNALDVAKSLLVSVPRAVYECRWSILAALGFAIVGWGLGWYFQMSDHRFFSELMGPGYTDMTLENMENGNPTGVYQRTEPWAMFAMIFINNFKCAIMYYIMGIFVLVGPIFYILLNFIIDGSFNAFFAQHGYLFEALTVTNEHGTLELLSFIIVCGAAIHLGTGWLFPGKLSRLKALGRSARHSLLVLLSTLPVILLAAIIESFITRHVEWPVSVRFTIIIVSLIFMIGYYVMLPLLARRR